ncbi:MAG: hypothetical protein ACJ8J0_17710, partial [Longimicrobiaceae bacterium]
TGGTGFDTAYVPRIETDAILALVSDSGLTLDDVNEADSTVHLSREEVGAALTHRSGRAFTSLVHLAHIYSQPYPQYSSLRFTHDPAGLVVSVADWYRVRFVREAGRMRMRRISYVMLEGE